LDSQKVLKEEKEKLFFLKKYFSGIKNGRSDSRQTAGPLHEVVPEGETYSTST